MRKYILLSFLGLTIAQAASAGVFGGGGGPPPVASEGVDLETGVLTIEKEISEIVEVTPTDYTKYVLDSALGKPVMIEGKPHTADLMDITNGRMVVKPATPKGKRLLLQRKNDKATEASESTP